MAALNMTTFLLLSVCFFAGLSYGQDKQCSTDKVQVFSKMVTCITKDHPEYFLTVLTKMDNPAAMERPDFMCSNPGMMSAMVECLLQYVEGCMPPSVASQVATVMPSHNTVARGVKFLCNHRKDFDHPCVTEQVANLVQCITTKMEAFSHATQSANRNIQEALCIALRVEEQCLATNLAGCPASVTSDLMSGIMAFFPAENCHIRVPEPNTVLVYESEKHH